ncbi:hypothetical protein ABIE78_005242 [Sinorhizobium fredii]
MIDAESGRELFGILVGGVALLLGAEHLHPAVLADKLAGAGRVDQVAVLGDGILDQRRVEMGDALMLGEARVPPVPRQERHQAWQRAEVIAGIDGVVQRVAEKRPEVVREAIGENALPLDEAGIAERRLLARAAAIEKHHRFAAPRQVNGARNADDPGAQYHYISFHR